jgi:hypothetical protein
MGKIIIDCTDFISILKRILESPDAIPSKDESNPLISERDYLTLA